MFSMWKKWTSLALAAAISISAPSYVHAEDLLTDTSSTSGVTENTDGEGEASPARSCSDTASGKEKDNSKGKADTESKSPAASQSPADSRDSASSKSVSADSSSDTGDPEDGTSIDLSGLDFSSMRLVIGTGEASLVASDTAVVGSCDDIYLAQYGSVQATEKAYEKYYGKADFVEPDTGLGAAEEPTGDTSNTMTEEPMTEDNNPMEELSSVDPSSGKLDSADAVALIDTGSSSYTSDSVSMLGDDGKDRNGHGTNMAGIIREEAGNIPILSIKALNDKGDGTVSSVYTAIEYAISQDVKVINLSLSGYAMNDSEAIDQAVNDAASAGILVVGAAGNNGKDVKYFVPGKIGSAIIVGACDKNGKRLETSNYGDTVDYYVTAESTSEAAARFSGLLAKNGFVVDDTVKAGGVFTEDGESLGSAEEKTEENADKNTDEETKLSAATDTITVTLNANGGTFSDGSTTKQVQCTKEWWTSVYLYANCKKTFPYPNNSGYACYGWNTTATATSDMSGNLTDGETLYAVYTAASGTWGTCPWSFDTTTNILTIGAGTGNATRPWSNLASRIVKVNATGKIILPSDSSSLFYGCSSMTSINAEQFNSNNVTNMSKMFSGCSKLTALDLSNFDTSNVTNMSKMFSGCSSLTALDLSNFDTSNVTNMSNMFTGCSSLTALDISKFNTSNVTSMNYMFDGCSSLTALDVSKFDTSNVKDMSRMFFDNWHLTILDVSNFNTSKVTHMSDMFNGCSKLTALDLSNFDTSNVTNMSNMFTNCSKLTALDISKFNTSNVTSMNYMFDGCSSLTTLDLSNFDTSKVTNMSDMFDRCSKLTELNLSSFDTSQVFDMYGMFEGCSKLTALDLSNFDTSQVKNTGSMFEFDFQLGKLTLGTNFIVSSTINTYMFSSPTQTISGLKSTGKWGLGSENAATVYSADELITLGQTKGKLAGTWYAQAAEHYTLTYNGNGGTSSTTSTVGYPNSTWGTLATATRPGYTFQGWYTAASGGTQVTSNTSCTANLTVYAHWTANTCTVTYNANGGSGSMENSTATYGKGFVTSKNAFTRTGYTFTGWNEKPDGTGTAWKLTSTGVYENGNGAHPWVWTYTSGITLYAQWTANTYTVAFNANGGSGTMANESMTYDIAKTLTANSFARTGYTFAGWNTKADGTGTSYAAKANVKNLTSTAGGTVTLYAKWRLNTYTITYNPNGGTNSSANPSSYNVTSADITLAAPTRTGYTFTGWTGSNGTTPQTTVTIPAGSYGNKSYTANWTPVTYAISYTMNGGTNSSSNPSGYNITSSAITLVNPTKSGWTFTGWSGTGLTGSTNTTVTIPSGSIGARSYTAHFSKTITLTQKHGSNKTTTQSYTLHDSESSHAFTLVTASTNYDGWTFLGWRDSATAGPKQYDPTGTITLSDSKTVYSTFSQTEVLTFVDYNDTTKQTRTVSGTAYGNGSAGGVSDQYPTLTAPAESAYTGWTARGWSTSTASNGSVTAASSASIANAKTATYYGLYQQNVTLSYAANGGASTPALQTGVRYANSNSISSFTNPSFTLAAAISRTGYTFAGWLVSAPISAVKSAGTAVSPASGTRVTATAQWTANSYTVAFNGNGNTGGSTGSESMTYDTAKALTANGFTKTGYTFSGWNTKADGSGTAYANSASVKNLTSTTGGTVTLYAQWKLNTYTDTIWHWTWGYNHQEGNNADKMAFHLGDTTFNQTYGSSYTLDASRGVTVPNGFVLRSAFGTSSTDGSWKDYSFGTKVTQTAGDMYFEYNYNPVTYSITYNLNGGTNSSANPSTYNVLYGVTFQNPTRTGYTFTGWTIGGKAATGINAGTNATFSSPSDLYTKLATRTTGNQTVTANWAANTYTVAFNANEGTGTMENESMTYDTAKALTANSFTRKGYTFSGWNTKADGTGTSYVDKDNVKNLTAANNGTVTLYAQWTANTYTVTIPTAITYTNMPTGSVDMTNTYNISVQCKTGSFGDTIEVSSTPFAMTSKSGKGKSLTVTSGSSKTPLSFTADGAKQDQATITGTTNTADTWTGSIQYTVTEK